MESFQSHRVSWGGLHTQLGLGDSCTKPNEHPSASMDGRDFQIHSWIFGIVQNLLHFCDLWSILMVTVLQCEFHEKHIVNSLAL